MRDTKKKVGLGIFIALGLLGVSILWVGNNTANYNPEIKAVDATPTLIEPATADIPALEPKIEITTSIATIGKREFSITSEGDFEHFACKAIKETVHALPANTDIIVKARRDKPFEVFRLDLLVDKLREQNLPFIVWEDVPVEDRPRAHFTTISSVKWGKKDDKFTAVPIYRDRRIQEFISFESLLFHYPEYGIGSKQAPVRKYKLTDAHSLVEIQGYFGLARYDETLFQNWTKGYSPFVGGPSAILGPFVTLRHPPENADSEAAIAQNLLDIENTLLEIFRDNQFLYTVTIEDKIQWTKQAFIKVTRFDPDQLARPQIDGEAISLSNKNPTTAPQGEAIKLCEMQLQLQ